jgi:hypothetical protein
MDNPDAPAISKEVVTKILILLAVVTLLAIFTRILGLW